MGMTYKMMVAKKSDLPKEGYDPWDFADKFVQVGEDLDREDWFGTFISEARDTERRKPGINLVNVRGAVGELKQLDRDVVRVWNDKRYSAAFRRRLAKGLVTSVFQHREYHYGYPKDYSDYSDGGGSAYYVEQLEKLIPYLDGKHAVWIKAI